MEFDERERAIQECGNRLLFVGCPDGYQRVREFLAVDIYTALGVPSELLEATRDQNAAHARMTRSG